MKFIHFLLCNLIILFYLFRKPFYDFILPPVSTQSEINQIIANEALLETTHLIQLYGYSAENHIVVTDDGYEITLHRIPRGKTNKNQTRIPIYLQHGAWVCSSTNNKWLQVFYLRMRDMMFGWVILEITHILKLSDNDTKDEIIGWNKLIVYEVPTIVDYIRNVTGFNQILAIGHSMGTTAMFGSLSINKKLNNIVMYFQDIKGFVALAPVSNAKYSSSVIFSGFGLVLQKFPSLFKLLYKDYNFPVKDFFLRLCPAIGKPAMCKQLVDLSIGFNPSSFNKTRFPIYIMHCFDSFPDQFFFHWVQAGLKNKMVGYDYGKEKNIENYNQYSIVNSPQFNC
uniref:Partial AB-hydrolase lipase domain-containing protein n=1 Tax=Strigamia maritima TaxID=126957 RepID=T1JB74_STRMM